MPHCCCTCDDTPSCCQPVKVRPKRKFTTDDLLTPDIIAELKRRVGPIGESAVRPILLLAADFLEKKKPR